MPINKFIADDYHANNQRGPVQATKQTTRVAFSTFLTYLAFLRSAADRADLALSRVVK
jgi:hypothetical protein